MLSQEEHAFWKRKAIYVSRQAVPTYPPEDMVAAGMASLVKSLKTYDPSSGMPQQNFILERMRWAMFDAAKEMTAGSRKDQKDGVTYTMVSLDKASNLSVSPEVSIEKIDLLRAIEKLTPKRKKFMLAYLKHDDVATAAREVGTSLDCARNLHWKSIRALRKIMLENQIKDK